MIREADIPIKLDALTHDDLDAAADHIRLRAEEIVAKDEEEAWVLYLIAQQLHARFCRRCWH